MKTSQKIRLIFFFSTAFAVRSAAQPNCDAPFLVEFNKLQVRSEKEYLLKLQEIYSSEERYNKQRNSGSGGGLLSAYGAGNFSSNKATVDKLVKKYSGKTNIDLTLNEKYEMSKVFASDESIRLRIDAWQRCIAVTSEQPYMMLEQAGTDEVIILLDLPQPRNNRRSVKIDNLTSTSNLTLTTEGIKKGAKLDYGTALRLKYKRQGNEEGLISINLKDEKPLKVTVPKINLEPVFITEEMDNSMMVKYVLNVSKNFIDLTMPDGTAQRLTFPNESGSTYDLNLKIRTKLKIDSTRVKPQASISASGKFKKFKYVLSAPAADDTWTIHVFLMTHSKKMTGFFVFPYTEKRRICIANCPIEAEEAE